VAHEVQPLIELYFEESADKALKRIGQVHPRVGASNQVFQVINPQISRAAEQLALNFCAETNATTSKDLNDALAQLREDVLNGVVAGDPRAEMRKRVNEIFDGAEEYRAGRIAVTETSRAIHSAERIAAKASGVVEGFKWLASADACDRCADLNGKVIGIDENYAEGQSKNPAYESVPHPPLHPNCQCSQEEIISDEDPAAGIALDDAEGLAEAFSRIEPEVSPLEPFGPSNAMVTHGAFSTAQANTKIEQLLGPGIQVQDIASLVGAQDGYDVRVTFGDDLVYVYTEGLPYTDEKGPHAGYTSNRELYLDDDGNRVIHNAGSFLKNKFRRGGVGMRIFGRQLETAQRLGFVAIETEAGRVDADDPDDALNGYYTWPLFGFDGPLLRKHKRLLPEPYRKARTIREVFLMPGGRRMWEEVGDTIKLEFDLSPESENVKMFDAYRRERLLRSQLAPEKPPQTAKALKRPPAVAEELYPDALDLAAAEAVWDRLEQKPR
jgi:SPP1 gp7 family putative phage head morphogenesis protein